MAIRVVLADDSILVREGLEHMLAAADDIEIAESCGDLPSLERAVEQHSPAVVVTDIRMPPGGTDEGIRFAASLRRDRPEVGVVVISHYAEPHYVLRLFESGSDGRAYLLKERIHDRSQLVGAIEAVAGGDASIDPRIVDVLIEARARAERSPLAELTPREMEVLRSIAQGRSNAAIAEELVLTKRAVEKHINAIFLKLGFTYGPESATISKRVKAALILLAEEDLHPAAG